MNKNKDDIDFFEINAKNRDMKFKYWFYNDIENYYSYLFHIYKQIKVEEMNEEKEKNKWLNIIDNFLNDIEFKNDNYYINTKASFKDVNNIKLYWHHNGKHKDFKIENNDEIVIKSPSFKKTTLELKYEFEKNLLNSAFYIKQLSYLDFYKDMKDKKEFLNSLENVLNKHINKFNYANDKQNKIDFEIEPLKEQINQVENKEAKKYLSKLIDNDNLSFGDYWHINNITELINEFNGEIDENKYKDWTYLPEKVSVFKQLIEKNENIEDLFYKSINEEQLEIINADYFKDSIKPHLKINREKELIIKDFIKNNAEAVIKLYLDENINIQTNQLNKKR